MNSIFNLPDVDGSELHPDVFKPNLGEAPSGYGQYDKLFQNNPYRNLEYKQSFWQRIASAFGFRTGADKFAEQAQLNAAEYDADVFALMQQNEFNSPTEQAERMREAGLNPDLLGTGDVAPAAQMRNDANGMQPSEGEGTDFFQVASVVSQGVLDLIPQVMSFATNLQQLKGIRVDNDLKELSFGQNARQAAEDFFMYSLTEQDYKEAFEKNDWTNVLNASESNAKYLADSFLSSKKARQAFNLYYGLYSRSLAAKMSKYKTKAEFEKAREQLFTQRGASWFSDDDATMESLMKSFLEPIQQYQNKLAAYNVVRLDNKDAKADQLLENTQRANQQIYENSIDTAQQATAENSQNKLVEQQNKIIEDTNQLFADIMESLRKQDNWWSKIAMSMVGIARAQLMSGISMHFGRNQQYKVDGDTGVLTEQGQSNFGISM